MQSILRHLLLCAPLSLALAAAHPELLSRPAVPSPGVRTATGTSSTSMFSGNGRYVVFTSDAPDLTLTDTNGVGLDVFRRDLATGQTERVSVLGTNAPAEGINSYGLSVSDDGQHVLFATEAPASEYSHNYNLYVRHLPSTPGASATTELVTVSKDGQSPADAFAFAGSLSGDGRYVLFESASTNLVAGNDTNLSPDIFLRDLENHTTLCVSTQTNGVDASDYFSYGAVMSRDAGVVAFLSESTDLIAPPSQRGFDHLYVWSRADGVVRRITVPDQPTSGFPRYFPFQPALSADGRYLAFALNTGFDGPLNGIWWRDLVAGTTVQISAGLGTPGLDPFVNFFDNPGPVMSSDGRTVAFEFPSAEVPSQRKVWIWNADSGLHSMESMTEPGLPVVAEPATSWSPVLSSDGSQIAFYTESAAPGTIISEGGKLRLVVRTLSTGETRALPVGPEPFTYEGIVPEFNADGTLLLFETEMVISQESDENDTADVFLADLARDEISLLSIAAESVAPSTARGASLSSDRLLSQDGRFVVFSSLAKDVLAGDINGTKDIFRLDRQTGQTVLVTRGLNDQPANGSSTPLQVSPDGQFVLFASRATNLVANDANRGVDLFVADLTTGTVVVVTAKDGDNSPAGVPGIEPFLPDVAMMSADGKRVVFISESGDLVPQQSTYYGHAFLRDLDSKHTYLLSRDENPALGLGPAGDVRQVAIQEDGRKAAFLTRPTFGGGRNIFLYDVATQTTHQVTTNRFVDRFDLSSDGDRVTYFPVRDVSPRQLFVQDLSTREETVVATLYGPRSISLPLDLRMSGDGNSLVFVTPEAFPPTLTGVQDTNNASDVFHYDIRTKVLSLVSVGDVGQLGDKGAGKPQISRDGKRVVFRSAASNLVPGDTNRFADVFLWEAGALRSVLLSANPVTGNPADSVSSAPAISSDGSYVTFVSMAADLVDGDFNARSDVFGVEVASLAEPDVDADGLADAWEQTYFNNLGQSAADDSDGDGATNLDEFLAGTNPTQAASVFRLTQTSASAGEVTFTWQSQAGVLYRLEGTTALGLNAFLPLGDTIVGDGTVKSATVPTSSAAAFMRVRAER